MWFLIATSPAATLVVPDGGSISNTIAAAAPGDIVVLEGDEYIEEIVIDKDLTLVGVPGTRTLLRSNTTFVLDVAAPVGVTLVDLHINGWLERLAIRRTMGDVRMSNVWVNASDDLFAQQLWRAEGSLALVDCELRTHQQGAIGLQGTLDGWNVRVSQNSTFGSGVGLRVDSPTAVARFWDSSLGGNTGNSPGSSISVGSGTVEVVRSSIGGNVGGAAVWVSGGSFVATQSTFRSNESEFEAGTILNDNGSVRLVESLVCDSFSWNGPTTAIESYGGLLEIEGSLFAGNSGLWGTSPAIDATGVLDIQSSTLVDGGIAITSAGSVADSLFANSDLGIDGAPTYTGTNAFWNNVVDASPPPTGTLITTDPVLQSVACSGSEIADYGFDPATSSLYDGSNWLASHAAYPTTACAPTTVYRDIDGDGRGDAAYPYTGCDVPTVLFVADDTDCDDRDADRFPGNVEDCDGIDNDCNGLVDDGPIGTSWHADTDGDDWGDAQVFVVACDPPAPTGWVDDASDCDDTNAAVSPDATEIDCDGIDNDCDQATEDGPNLDGDAFLDCPGADCDDLNENIHPDAAESCNDVDDDCDGEVDEELPLTTYFTDLDLDGYGVEGTGLATCDASPPLGRALITGDCDDTNATVYPTADDLTVCDGVDNDCDGTIDNPADDDGDTVTYCDDCDDQDPTAFPGNPEGCDGVDNDCNGDIDDTLTFVEYWFDGDGDGFGSDTMDATCDGAPDGYVGNTDDCDDTNSAAYPGADEQPGDGADLNCDGVVPDDPEPEPGADLDGDGFSGDNDCDETDPTVYVGAPEDLSEIDRDCDGFADPQGRIVTSCSTVSGPSPWTPLAWMARRR